MNNNTQATMSESQITPWRENDIFRWSYKDRISIGKSHTDLYWCKSRIFIFRNGHFVDTYWHGSGDNSTFSMERIEKDIDLEYLGNFDELERTDEWNQDYYEEKDIVNLNHPNSRKGNVYLRKGAQKSRDKMLEVATYNLEKAESKLRSAEWDVQRSKEKLAELQSDKPTSEIYL